MQKIIELIKQITKNEEQINNLQKKKKLGLKYRDRLVKLKETAEAEKLINPSA